jgi:hypothetical protein
MIARNDTRRQAAKTLYSLILSKLTAFSYAAAMMTNMAAISDVLFPLLLKRRGVQGKIRTHTSGQHLFE